MAEINSRNKRIAKNTVYLYFRMLLIMAVSLYTSRVVLNILGVDDFGLYQTVGGIVALLSYMNNALSVGTSRFLTYELGTGNFDKLKMTFSTALSVHIIFSLIIVLFAETVGLWYVYNKLVVPLGRLDAAIFAYHISVLTIFISITQIPYNSSIISHEKMKIYALVSIIDVVLKLLSVYLLAFFEWDRLKIYAVLLFLIQLIVAFSYRVYCIRNFEECRYSFLLNRKIFKEILSYSGWNFVATSALAICNHGITILLNLFFSPVIVASRTIASQVNAAANQFLGNFRTAIEPQVVKQYAAKNYDDSRNLLLESTKYSFYIMLVLALPICVVARQLIKLWIGFVPDYAPEFLQVAVLTSLVEVFNRSFYTPLYAKGNIKANANIYAFLLLLGFIIIFVLFKKGCGALFAAYVIFIVQLIMSFIIKPVLLVKIANYPLKDILSVICKCLKVFFVAVVILFPIYNQVYLKNINSVSVFFISAFVSFSLVCLVVWFVGLDKNLKKRIVLYAKNKLLRAK